MLPPPTNTKSKRDSRCLHNSAGVIKTREAVQCACKDPIEQRWEPNQFAYSKLSSVHLSKLPRNAPVLLSNVYAGILEVGDVSDVTDVVRLDI